MRSGSVEYEFLVGDPVDQQPIWRDVAFAMMLPVSTQRVGSVPLCQRLFALKLQDERLQQLHLLATFLGKFCIALELRRDNERKHV